MKPHFRVVLAFGLLVFFSFMIWGKPQVTGRVTSELPQTVVVVLKAQSSSAITGAFSFDEESPSLDELRVSTSIAQQEVLEDVNAPTFVERLFGLDPVVVEAERTLDIVPAMVVEATPDGIDKLEAHPLVEAVYPNIQFELTLGQSVPLINADDVWQVNGVDGSGKSVCVIDTGISPHQDFQNRIVNQKCFCSPSCCPNGQATDALAADTHPISHGTHVSGIIAANGALYKGVAPGAGIVAVKVCNLGCGLADIFAGIDYCLQVKDQFDVVAISGSIGDGGNYQSQQQCPTYFDVAIDAAYSAGITSVFASGNNGYSNGISYPGCNPRSIAVGATDKNDVMASFTNRGQLLDVLAPGVAIISTKANNQYGSLSGTSQATPHVSGVVALLQHFAELHSISLTPDQIRQILQDTGVLISGFKRVDALAAVQSLAPPTTSTTTTTTTSTTVSTVTSTTATTTTTLPSGNNPPSASISFPGAVANSPVTLEGSASDLEDGELAGTWSEGETVLGTGNQLVVPFSPGEHTVVFSASDSQSASAQDYVTFTSQTCRVDVDQNGNNQFDIGDLVILISGFFGENLQCNVESVNSFCTAELDMNANGILEIGDLVLLLRAYSEESLQCGT
jgi:subtilisin family serine protease